MPSVRAIVRATARVSGRVRAAATFSQGGVMGIGVHVQECTLECVDVNISTHGYGGCCRGVYAAVYSAAKGNAGACG